ncbi:hypothetical protein, partial [Klebsiella pneumoniae]|uniref:hypothetical protein n=1 Tax=Klebsiella pneumoniae TaxID=573 RepID=UPI0019676AE6
MKTIDKVWLKVDTPPCFIAACSLTFLCSTNNKPRFTFMTALVTFRRLLWHGLTHSPGHSGARGHLAKKKKKKHHNSW